MISTVMDGLYLANWRGADDKDRVKELGVTHMVAVGTEFVDDKMEGIIFWKKDIGDDEDAADEMANSLREVAGFIHKSISAAASASCTARRASRAARRACSPTWCCTRPRRCATRLAW